jgi:hypothetical protein
MNDAELNRIIEETFQNIVRNEGPAIFTSLSNFVYDISSNLALSPPILPSAEESVQQQQQQQQSVNDLSSNPVQPDNHNDLLDDFSMRWFQQLNNYHNCMRDYHKNIVQMNRISNSLLMNIASPQTSRLYQPSIGIHGFSIPLRQFDLPTQHHHDTYPSISQIMAAVEVFPYTDEHRLRGLESRCPISLEDFVLGDELCEIRNCHHIFKWTNLQSWFSRNSICPVCRFDISG